MQTETYRPVVLARRARAIQIASGNPNIHAPFQPEKKTAKEMVTVVFARPVRMFTEPLILCTCLFLTMVTGLQFLYFEAYPIVFEGN